MEILQTYAERKKSALDTLVKLGAMIYAKDIETYHGRAGDGSKWEVDPTFNNAGNNTGNSNVYDVSGLYTTDSQHAKEFATKRRRSHTQTADVYKIVAKDEDLAVVVQGFSVASLSKQQQDEYYQAISVLAQFPITEMVPIPFEYRSIYAEVKKVIQQQYKTVESGLFKDEDIENVINTLATNPDVRKVFGSKQKLIDFITGLLSASNTKRLISMFPANLIRQFLDGEDKISVKMGESDFEISINSKYVSAWCAKNGIIGSKGKVTSATLCKTIDIVTFFDTKKIETEAQQGERIEYMNRLFEGLSLNLSDFIQDEEINTFLQKASASEVMQFICQDEKCYKLFEKDAGLWEGYTVGQHTEAVLDFLGKYKLEEIHPQLLPFIKVAILAHDIGKGFASDSKSMWAGKHKDANKVMANFLFNALGIDAKYRKLINFIFTESQDFTSKYYFDATNSSSPELTATQKQYISDEMQKACKEILTQTLGVEPTEEEIYALQKICIILQQCDSGAYTRYATLKDKSGLYYTGGNDRFTSSFVIGKNGMPRLKTFQDEDVFKK